MVIYEDIRFFKDSQIKCGVHYVVAINQLCIFTQQLTTSVILLTVTGKPAYKPGQKYDTVGKGIKNANTDLQ